MNRFAALAAFAISLAIASPALAQDIDDASEDEEPVPFVLVTAPVVQLTAPVAAQTLPPTAVYGARVAPARGPEVAVPAIFPRLRFGIGWAPTIMGSRSLVAGGVIGVRIDLGARINRWFGFYTTLNGATSFVYNTIHGAAMLEFYPHRAVSISTGIGVAAFAYSPLCLFGGCGGPRSDEAVTMPIRVTFFTNRSSDDQPRGGFSVGAEFFPGFSVGDSRGAVFGGALFLGYSRL